MTEVNRKLKREACVSVFSRGRRRHVVVELSPPGDVIGFRLKGERSTYYLPIDWCYRTATDLAVRAARRAKREGKTS